MRFLSNNKQGAVSLRFSSTALFLLLLIFPVSFALADQLVIAGQYVVVPAEIEGASAGDELNFDPEFSGFTAGLDENGNNFLVESAFQFASGVAPGTVVEYDQVEHEDFCDLLRTQYPLEFCEPNAVLSLDAVPNDSLFGSLWGMSNIKAPEAWNISQGSDDVVVAVLDTGIDYNHPDLAANSWINGDEIAESGQDNDGNGYVDDRRGWDFYNNDSNPYDDHGHGTHCAGTIGAVGNNNLGVAGVSWRVKLMPVKFLASNGAGTTFGAIAAIDYASENGADIINASFGGSFKSDAMEAAIARARDRGVLFVAAAGNSASNNDSKPQYPANYDVDNIISVAATDSSDKLTFFSNYGALTVDIAAPGLQILSTLPGGGYGYMSGTSMAAPHVAGLAALYKGLNPSASYQEIKNAILSTVDPISALQGKMLYGGRINALRTLGSDGSAPGEYSPVAELNAVRFTANQLPLKNDKAIFNGTPGLPVKLTMIVTGETYYECSLGTAVLGARGKLRVVFPRGGLGKPINLTTKGAHIYAESLDGGVGSIASRRVKAAKKLRRSGRVRAARSRARQQITSSLSEVMSKADSACSRMQQRVKFRAI